MLADVGDDDVQRAPCANCVGGLLLSTVGIYWVAKDHFHHPAIGWTMAGWLLESSDFLDSTLDTNTLLALLPGRGLDSYIELHLIRTLADIIQGVM